MKLANYYWYVILHNIIYLGMDNCKAFEVIMKEIKIIQICDLCKGRLERAEIEDIDKKYMVICRICYSKLVGQMKMGNISKEV